MQWKIKFKKKGEELTVASRKCFVHIGIIIRAWREWPEFLSADIADRAEPPKSKLYYMYHYVQDALFSPSHFLWSCGLTQWCICLLCTFDSIQMHVHISIQESFYSIHSKCQQQRANQLTKPSLPLVHSQHWLQNWTDKPFLGSLGKTWRSAHHDWQDGLCNGCSCMSGDNSEDKLEKFSPWSRCPIDSDF